MTALEEKKVAAQYGLEKEWEAHVEEMDGVLDPDGYPDNPDLYRFLARHGKTVPIDIEILREEWEFENMEIVEQTPYAVLLKCDSDYYIMRTWGPRIRPISHPFFSGLGPEKLHVDDAYPLTEKDARERWAIWLEWETEAKRTRWTPDYMPALDKWMYIVKCWPHPLDTHIATSDSEYLELVSQGLLK